MVTSMQKTSSCRAKKKNQVKKPPRSIKRKKTKLQKMMKKSRFLCDCAFSFLILMAVGCSGWQWWQQVVSQRTRVLGWSSKLNSEEILVQINLERAKAGLSALKMDDKLKQAAWNKGEDMFQDDYWAHVNPDGTQPWEFIQDQNYVFQAAGENLARDFNTEQSLVAAWMASPSHRDNILNERFQDTGIAVLDGQINGQNVLLVVNFFAQPQISKGEISQIASYSEQTDGQVLAGQVWPRGEIVAAKKHAWQWWQWLIVAGVLTGMIQVSRQVHAWRTKADN